MNPTDDQVRRAALWLFCFGSLSAEAEESFKQWYDEGLDPRYREAAEPRARSLASFILKEA